MGLDGLNPIQARCGVTPKMIKERYPHLTMVGTVDVQYTLPFGSPEEIENEIREIISVAAHGGGLVIGPQHAVQPDVPIENVETIIRAIRKYGQYSLSL
jgi:uroporphyrinogen-III decarboxylase